MPTFPILYYDVPTGLVHPPDAAGFREILEDSTIRSKTESGYMLTRRRFSRTRKTFVVPYAFMKHTAKLVLEDFIMNTVFEGALSFDWTHPITAVVHQVAFTKLPEFEYVGMNGTEASYSFTFEIMEI